MESDEPNNEGGDFQYADSEDGTLHETSFVTATEGERNSEFASVAESPASIRHRRICGLDRDLSPGTSPDNRSPARSSRSMPVPEYLERKAKESLVMSDRGTDSSTEPPPPSYEEAVRGNTHEEPPPLAASGPTDNGLSAEEIAVVMRMRSQRDTYISTDERQNDEAIEMNRHDELGPRDHYPNNNVAGDNTDSAMEEELKDERSSLRLGTLRMEDLSGRTIEEGHVERRESVGNECTSLGPLNGAVTRIRRFLARQPPGRLILLLLLGLGLVGLILFLGLFPASFVYIDYHQIALAQSKMTNSLDRDHVYYPGCHILGPDTKLMYFQGSAHSVTGDMSVFTSDTISISIRFNLQYFIRPQEVGQLYTLFAHDYDSVFRIMIKGSIRTVTGSQFSVDNFRFNRTYVEKTLHSMLRRKLGGTCCPKCCATKSCQSNDYCGTCNSQTSCKPGYHVDVRIFNLLFVSIPDVVFERYLRKTILDIETEKEFFIQEHAVIVKETEKLTRQIKNDANEIQQAGQFNADKIRALAEADKEATVQKSYIRALDSLFNTLNTTSEDHRLSYMLVRTLEDSAENLYSGYAYEQNILYTP